MMPPWAPAKRSQPANATYRSIVGRNKLRAFGHHVAMCCNMLGVVGSSLKIVKFEPTTPNMSQQGATGWPNARNMLRPTMLRHVALACCDRLAGALSNTKQYRSGSHQSFNSCTNIVVHSFPIPRSKSSMKTVKPGIQLRPNGQAHARTKFTAPFEIVICNQFLSRVL